MTWGSEGQETSIGVLAAMGARATFDAGAFLLQQGDTGDEVFVILEGRAEVLVTDDLGGALALRELGPGDLIGEASGIGVGVRSASVRAKEVMTAAVIERDQFRAWLGDHPVEADAISARARDRLDRSQLAGVLASIVGDAHRDLVPLIVDRTTWKDLPAGEVLFDQGDASDAAYIILSGRVLASGTDASGTTMFDRELGRGEIVGEVGLVDAAPRSGRVQALRDTTLGRIALEDFQALMLAHPSLMLRVFRAVLVRSTSPAVERSGAASVAVVVTAPVDTRVVTTQMLTEIRRHGSAELVSSGSIDAALGVRGIAQVVLGQPGASRVADLMHDHEVAHDHVIYEADPTLSEWTSRIILQSDRLVLVTSAAPEAEERARIEHVLRRSADARRASTWLAHFHPRNVEVPVRPDLAPELVDAVSETHHLRERNAGDLARLARLASGHGVGVVLGGGGARGYAHLGVLRALRDLGVPVDRIAGASMGAVLAGFVAIDLDEADTMRAVESGFDKPLDYTIPVVSLTKGERIRRSLEDNFGSWPIEDTWIPYACISTNLTAATVGVHRSGNMAKAIRASVAIPGVIPPVSYGDHLHVDGGVLNNLPIDVMAADSSVEHVIAVDVAPPQGPRAKSDFGLSVSGWKALGKKLTGGGSSYPALSAVLMRSLLVGSSRDRDVFLAAGMANLYLDLDLRGVALLEFEKLQPTIDAGHEQALPRIKEWLSECSFSP